MPASPATISDLGCGTGTIAVLLAREGYRLVLVEGRWSTGAGIPAVECRRLVLQHRREALVEQLVDHALWGRQIDDGRYVLLSRA